MNRSGMVSVFVLALALIGCQNRSAERGTSGGSAAVASASSGHGATPHAVHVQPSLLESGRIRTTRASRRPPTGTLRLPANVVASPEGSAEAGTLVAGRIARFEVREGDHVKPGQVLAWLDSPEAARAMADLVRARAKTETQQRKVARLEGLVASEAVTQMTVEEARLDLELARADLAAARTLIGSFGLGEPKELGANLRAQVPVTSPIAGTIVERTVPLGAHVTPETHLFRLVGEASTLVDARLPDGMTLGGPARARVLRRDGDPDKPCDARVLTVFPEVDTATRTRRVRLLPEAACTGLLAGGQVEVEVDLPLPHGDAGIAADVITVPAKAAIAVKSATVVFVKTGPAAFELRPIEPGPRLGDDLVVRAGIEDSDEVVTEGTVLLKGELLRAELGGEE